MAAAAAVHGGYLPSKFRELSATISKSDRKRVTRRPPPPPPIFISTNPTHVNPNHLRDLCSLSNHSCHRFPNLDSAGRVEPVDLDKLRIALSHSSVVVSVFAKPEVVSSYSSSSPDSQKKSSSSEISNLVGIDWFQRVMPVTPSNGRLVGFGRAVSDCGLTASIYDVMVIPALRGMGIGRMVVKRIIRVLTSRDIYDIAALCSDKESSFFEACGFGDDILGSTTMMYGKTVSSSPKSDQMVSRAGRRLLLAPPPRGPSAS
ncbi:GCN5-related N-acetyltransferase 3, chloroplastic-like [Cornus florida]|uniref:GCN5-related N-acetyltransferase 3, chloroplastic-like n=1 Tax=Cornus florida TaxID=4283 RepID=UPI00289D47AC|nr:GCN5-related N-acetyltransferase 3, chloroplastic-like [Cornus florida]